MKYLPKERTVKQYLSIRVIVIITIKMGLFKFTTLEKNVT